MAAQYKTVEYELGYMVCDGPEGPSLLTTLFNFLRIVAPRSQQSTPPYLEKKGIQDILLTLSMQICARKKQNLAGLCLNQLILDLGPQSYVTPILGSNVYFEETQEFRVYDIFVQLEIPICHCWVVDPDSKTICPNVENYSYEKLQKYSQVLENLSERVPDVVQKRAVVQNLLEAHSKQFTSYGYVTLCEQMQENGFIVLYWDNKFYVMHKHDGNLLLLETNSGILKEYPEVRWRVFEEVDRDTIYLNAHFSPANAQPNFARAVSWHQSKVSGRSVESSEPKGSGARTTLTKGQKKRLKNRLAKEAEAEALNKHDLGEDQQEASMEAASAVSDDKLGRTEGSDAEESRSQLPSDGNTDQSTSSQVPAVVSSKPNQQEAFNAALASSDDKLNQQEQSNRHEVSSEEHTVSHPSACGTSSHTIAEEDESKSTVGEDFLKFLLLFNDGTSRFKDGSSTERVPFFEGMVEALKFTGSPIFYVPFKFIEMYDTSLAGTIQDSYPRISKDLTESVCKYLANHGVDIAAQLEILHLPEPRLDILHPPEPSVQLFLDFVKDLDFLEEYDVFAFRLEYSPSYHSRKMALGYLHVIVDNFRKGRCFGGKWDESNMLVHQGSRFSIACEDQAFTPSLGYLDLCKFDACVLQRFKNSNGRLPIYFKELKDDFLLISDSFKDQKRWERFLLLISYPFALAAPIVRSTFVLDIYRAADSESSGKDYAYSPLNTRIGIRDWRDKATAHSLFKYVFDHKNYGNGTWTSVYTFTKWAVSHWSLFKFSRHFISHVLRYTKIINGGQQVRDLAIVDIMLGRQLGPYIAQSIRFFIFNCDLDGLFSCPWRHFVSSDCMDKPKQTIAIATEKFEDETSTSAHSVSNSTSYMECAHRTGWAITRVGKDLSQEPLRWDALIANVDLTEFALFLEENAMEAVVAKEGDAVSLTCGTINVSKSYRQILVGDFLVEGTKSDLVIAVEGPMCDDFHAVFELLCLWLSL